MSFEKVFVNVVLKIVHQTDNYHKETVTANW